MEKILIIILISRVDLYPKYFNPNEKYLNITKITNNYKENENPEKCFCDLTKYFCDKNCCCDLDCEKKEINNFKYCLEKKNGKNLIKNKCGNGNFVDEKFGIEILDLYFEENFVKNSIFCVEEKNLPEFEEFFEKIEDVSFEVKENVLKDKESAFYYLDRDYFDGDFDKIKFAGLFLSYFLFFFILN